MQEKLQATYRNEDLYISKKFQGLTKLTKEVASEVEINERYRYIWSIVNIFRVKSWSDDCKGQGHQYILWAQLKSSSKNLTKVEDVHNMIMTKTNR